MESLTLGAYWGDRDESVEQSTERFVAYFGGLARLNEALLGRWYQKGNSRRGAKREPLVPSREIIGQLLLRGRYRTDVEPPEVMEDLGFRVDLWNGQSADVSLSVKCAAHGNAAKNLALLSLPYPEGEALELYRGQILNELLTLMVECWDPRWGSVFTSSLRNQTVDNGIAPGWATYVRGARFAVVEGADVEIVNLRDGDLVSLRSSPLDELESGASHVRRALTRLT